MAAGDDAAAAGMPIVPATAKVRDGYVEINRTRDLIVTWVTTKLTAAIAALWPLPISQGGTGATTAAGARTAIGAPHDDIGTGLRFYSPGFGRLSFAAPGVSGGSEIQMVGGGGGGGGGDGLADGPTTAAYNRPQGGTGQYSVWMNAQSQFMRGTSSRRYKQNIRDWTSGTVLGIRPVIFDRIDGDPDEIGVIAEEVADVLPEAVSYFGGQIDGVHDRVMLVAAIAEIQRLAARVAQLEQSSGT